MVKFVAAVVFAVVLAAVPALAQSADDAFVESVTVNRVRWPVLVTPRGSAATACAALVPADLVVEEDGQEAAVSRVESQRGGTLYAFLVDTSRSMDGRLEQIKNAASAFARELAATDQVAVYSFGRELALGLSPTRDAELVERAIGTLRPDAIETGLIDALHDLVGVLADRPERKVIVLLSDSGENASRRHGPEDLLAIAASFRDLRIFPVTTSAVDDLRNTSWLRRVAAVTASTFEMAPDEFALKSTFRRIRERMDAEVMITYAPPPHPGPARAHRVEVRARAGLPCRVNEARADREPGLHK